MATNGVTETVALAIEADGYWRSKPPLDDIPPSVPIAGAVTVLSSSSLRVDIATVSTDSQSGLSAYNVYARISPSPTWVLRGSGASGATYVDATGLNASQAYELALTGVDGSPALNESDKSNIVTGTTSAATSSSWPLNFPMVVFTYSIGASRAVQLGESPYREYMLDKDLIVYQSGDLLNASERTAERDQLTYIHANATQTVYMTPYRIMNTEAKTTTSGTTTRFLTTLLDGSHGVANWRVKNSANARLEHSFSPSTQWRLNEAVHVAGLNDLGENLAEAAARVDHEYCLLDSPTLEAQIDGRYLDDTNPIPGAATTGNGATASGYDYRDTGTNNTGGNTVGADDTLDGNQLMHAKGVLSTILAFEAEFPDQYLVINGARVSFDWVDGSSFTQSTDPALPLSTHPWYGRLPSMIAEFAHSTLGVMNTTDGMTGTFGTGGTPDSFHYRYFNWNQFWRDANMKRVMMRPDTASRRFFVGLEAPLAYRKNGDTAVTAKEASYMRLYTALALMESRYAVCVSCRKVEPITPDEALLELGDAIGAWSMGVLNETTLAYTVRTRDLANGSAQFWWQEFTKAIVVVRGDSTGISNLDAYPGGTGVACTLPSAGAGFHWARINSATYVNPLTTRAMRGQDTTTNSGATVTSVTLKPLEAIILRRVAD